MTGRSGEPDVDELIEALTSSLDTIQQFYDRETGEVVAMSDEFGFGELDGPADRYVAISPLSVSDRFQIMEDFVETVENESLEDELNESLIEKGAFLKFEETIRKYPSRYEQWRAFKRAALISRARAWLREHGIG